MYNGNSLFDRNVPHLRLLTCVIEKKATQYVCSEIADSVLNDPYAEKLKFLDVSKATLNQVRTVSERFHTIPLKVGPIPLPRMLPCA